MWNRFDDDHDATNTSCGRRQNGRILLRGCNGIAFGWLRLRFGAPTNREISAIELSPSSAKGAPAGDRSLEQGEALAALRDELLRGVLNVTRD